jgi:hypothetical protein
VRSQSIIEEELNRLHDSMEVLSQGSNHDVLNGAAQALAWALGRAAVSPSDASEIICEFKKAQAKAQARANGAAKGSAP